MMIASDNGSVWAHQVLLKVPFHFSWERARLRQVVIERMFVATFHADLAEQWEGQTVFRKTEAFDFFVRAWFLLSKVIGWKC